MHLCVKGFYLAYIVYEHSTISCTGPSEAGPGKSVQRLCGDCMEIVQLLCSLVASARKSYRACMVSMQMLHGAGAVTVQRLRGNGAVTVHAPYDISTAMDL